MGWEQCLVCGMRPGNHPEVCFLLHELFEIREPALSSFENSLLTILDRQRSWTKKKPEGSIKDQDRYAATCRSCKVVPTSTKFFSLKLWTCFLLAVSQTAPCPVSHILFLMPGLYLSPFCDIACVYSRRSVPAHLRFSSSRRLKNHFSHSWPSTEMWISLPGPKKHCRTPFHCSVSGFRNTKGWKLYQWNQKRL